METLEQIKTRLEVAVPGAQLQILANTSPCQQTSLLVDSAHLVEVATFLRDDAQLQLDFCSSVAGVDYLDQVFPKAVKTRVVVNGVETELEDAVAETKPGFLEVVYHLYSMALKQGPVILRQRTVNRTDQVLLRSLTPLWRGCELQEREVFDLYGVIFDGHPDLRRVFMWDNFKDHPMRKDYVGADDFEYEPTPHDDVFEMAKRHYPRRG